MNTLDYLRELRGLQEDVDRDIEEMGKEASEDGYELEGLISRQEALCDALNIITKPDAYWEYENSVTVLQDWLNEMVSDYRDYDIGDIIDDEGNTPRIIAALQWLISTVTSQDIDLGVGIDSVLQLDGLARNIEGRKTGNVDEDYPLMQVLELISRTRLELIRA
jgi:hypothetical protein